MAAPLLTNTTFPLFFRSSDKVERTAILGATVLMYKTRENCSGV